MYEYKAKVKKVIDGDTVDCYIDMGFNVGMKVRIRLNGIDTPESRTRDLEEKRYGLGAKRRVEELLGANDDYFVVLSHGVGKFGRCLGEIFLPGADGKTLVSLNNRLVLEGHAIPYTGGSKEDERQNLIEARKKSKDYVERHIKPLD